MELFNRCYIIRFYDVNAKLILEYDSSLEIKFHINQKIGLINSIAEFHIYNMAESSKELAKNATSIVFSAGYDNQPVTIYRGQIMNAFSNRAQPDYVFSIYSLDYSGFIEPLNIITEAGSTQAEIIQAVSQDAGIIVQQKNLQGLSSAPWNKSYSFVGLNYQHAYEKLAVAFNINIFVVNGNVFTLPRSYLSPNIQPIIVNYLNGMLESPNFDVANAGVSVKTLLNPAIVPGGYINIQTLSPQVQLGEVNYANFNQNAINNGNWLVMEIDHLGDFRGDEWFSYSRGYSYQAILNGLLPQV